MDDVLTSQEALRAAPNNLEAFWMPYTANRQFKQAPRLLVSAEGMYYTSIEGRQIMDGTAGLWCVNAGHARAPIVQAVQEQVAHLDYAPGFQMSHPAAFHLAARLVAMMPGDLDHVFFTNSGSESCDTALKMALAYHRARGDGTRTKFIGRERGYHGCSFGGISVGGISPNRKAFGQTLLAADHLPHTHNLEHNAFSRGQPEWGAHLADDLEQLIMLHDASNVAAVMVEPFAGSAGVLLPPKGYLERLREICDKHGVLLIFDEVITGFGRLGASSAAEYFGVVPDIMTTAKGITNGVVPMGGVFVRKHVYDTVVDGPEGAIELFHGYTYSGHPLACAAANATMDVYQNEDLFKRADSLAPYWENALHSLADAPHVIDIRNLGLVGAVELEPSPDGPGKRSYDIFLRCYEKGVLVRYTGDIIALTPPLIIETSEIDRIVEVLGEALAEYAAG